jgi:6-phosphogluconate dehydrogenase
MQLGMIGLGRMGANMVHRLLAGGHRCAVFDRSPRAIDPIFAQLAPGAGDIPRTPGRENRDGTAEHGYLHCGPNGTGHFVKMVHNGIEYGIMAAYAEGVSILRSANIGKRGRRGSVVASWLLDLSAAALIKDPELKGFHGRGSDSGEGRWTVRAAIDEAVPAPVLSCALYDRFSSRGEADFADKLLSAMRYEFGGHLEN